MTMRYRNHVLPLLIAALLAPSAAFAGEGALQLASKVLVETRATAVDGSVRSEYTPARNAVPGDRVVFVLAYRNTGDQPLANLVFHNPLPAAITYRGPAQGSVAPELSVDGRTFGPIETLRVALAEGGTRAARADDVTHVRWRLAGALAARAQGQFAFQATLK